MRRQAKDMHSTSLSHVTAWLKKPSDPFLSVKWGLAAVLLRYLYMHHVCQTIYTTARLTAFPGHAFLPEVTPPPEAVGTRPAAEGPVPAWLLWPAGIPGPDRECPSHFPDTIVRHTSRKGPWPRHDLQQEWHVESTDMSWLSSNLTGILGGSKASEDSAQELPYPSSRPQEIYTLLEGGRKRSGAPTAGEGAPNPGRAPGGTPAGPQQPRTRTPADPAQQKQKRILNTKK